MLRGLENTAKGKFLSVDILLQIHAVSSMWCVKYYKNPELILIQLIRKMSVVLVFSPFLKWDVQKGMLSSLEMLEAST